MSLQRPIFVTSVLVVALLLSFKSVLLPPTLVPLQPVIDQNNTALFLVNSEHGISNVHVATAQALLERHPHIHLHFGSFKSMAPKLERLSSYRKVTHEKDLVFHPIEGRSLVQAIGRTTSHLIHFPGWAGIDKICKDMQFYISPWTGEEHLAIYEQVGRIIDEVDPAVVVLDWILRPAVDATRDKNRLHAIISPNPLIESFAGDQSVGKLLWKYPALRYITTMLWLPDLKEKQAYLKSKDVPWISQTMPEASIPVDVNVTCAGPMTLSLGTVAEQDEELAAWLMRGPTVLINLGSGFTFSERSASTMAEAIATILRSSEVQILWKTGKESSYGDEYMSPLLHFLEVGRVRIERWLAADPSTILESGHVVVSVHHGGSGCYHEAISAGIPQVILPQWLDLYGFAQLAEQIGVGAWGCKETSPFWTADCLSDAILEVVNEVKYRDKGKGLGRLAQAKPGRYVAAMEIAKLAGSGTSMK
ncbi:UDP-Glycosyltransferase/glycogen phosphorylase [Xylariaceae sp. FL1272]|nr:UDP-Glycosyltransferase/glycogen phosphorylase [Xylariaceae sp. FL1272]